MTDPTKSPIELEVEAAERSVDFTRYLAHPQGVKCPVHNIVERQMPGRRRRGFYRCPACAPDRFWLTPYWP